MPVWVSEIANYSDSLPTAKQWLATAIKEDLSVLRVVKLIWSPNKFQSFSVDTEFFRLRVPEEHPLYAILESHLDNWVEEDTVLALSFTSGKLPQVQLQTMDAESCTWELLGSKGYKAVRFTAKKKPVEPKPATKKSSKALAVPSEPQEAPSDE